MMSVDLAKHPEGCILSVRATPNANASGINGTRNGALLVSVTQAPEKGKANKEIQVAIAKWLKIRKSQVRLLSGDRTRQKKFLLAGFKPDEARERINDLLEN